MESTYQAVPDMGAVVERKQLLAIFRQSPVLTVVCAPPGYGKSILAAQMASDSAFGRVVWADCHGSDLTGTEAVVRIADGLGAMPRPESERVCAVAGTSAEDALLGMLQGLRALDGSTVCAVVDGCDLLEDVQPLEQAAHLMRLHAGAGSRLVVTCRTLQLGSHLPDPGRVWAVDSRSLRLSEAEVAELAVIAAGVDAGPDLVRLLLDRFAGHPALTSLMLRHPGLDDQKAPPQDLLWHAQRLVGHLSAESLETLYVAALLREGTLGQLAECLGAIQRLPDWDGMRFVEPLCTVSDDEVEASRHFRVHTVLGDALIQGAHAWLGDESTYRLRAESLRLAARRADHASLQRVLSSACTEAEIAHWLEAEGARMLRALGAAPLMRCLSAVRPERLSGSPQLLLVRAAALREQERTEEALRHASLAGQLAEALGDDTTRINAAFLEVRAAVDVSRFREAQAVLQRLQSELAGLMDRSHAYLASAYLSAIDAYDGRVHDATARIEAVIAGYADVELPSGHAATIANLIAAVEGVSRGRWDLAVTLLRRVAPDEDLSPVQRLHLQANLACALLELGSPGEALGALADVLSDAEAVEMPALAGAGRETQSCAHYLLGETEAGREAGAVSRHLSAKVGDSYAQAVERAHASMNLRAIGAADEALECAQQALDHLAEDSSGLELLRQHARTELAASHLSLGDLWSARAIAEQVRGALSDSGAAAHLLRVDLVLAELEHREGLGEAAASRLAAHREYLITGSANWTVAMYIRAFPALLGLLASGIGAGTVPARVLRFIPAGTAHEALACPGAFLRSGDIDVMQRRLAVPTAPLAPPLSAQPVYVRLFGGFEVSTAAEGVVADSHWRKRKSRTLLAMLAVRQGQDLPRDVVTERLWPEMSEEQARRNFYVTWSVMKQAMSHGGAAADSKDFVECRGGICRVTRAVRSDLDDFDEALSRLRAAQAAGDDDTVLECARAISRIYRGELLPGDIYDEWFTEVRERAKHDLCDAMMAGAAVAEGRGHTDVALMLLRKAAGTDPWREDVYRAIMRCQMHAGQRSSAIETFLTYRARLIEELGIDPAAETVRLYQAVLAMEDDDPYPGPGKKPAEDTPVKNQLSGG